MGLTPEFKKFLCSLFPECFSSTLPQGKKFSIVIKEVLPNIVPKIFGITKTTNTTIRQLCVGFKTDCSNILCNTPSVSRLILLMDNYNQVPGNKSLTEMKRDKNISKDNNTWLNEEEYLKLRHERNLWPGDLIIKDENDNINKIDGQILWRDCNFRWLIHYTLTREFTKMFVPEGRVLIIDDGLFYDEKELKSLKEEILNKHNMNNKFITDYEKDCLFSFEIKNYFKQGYIFPDHKINLQNSSGIGESDLKIVAHINKNGTYLVISPDSDVIAMLLLHIKSLIDPETLLLDCDIFMDTQTSFDKAYQNSRDTRFININLLFFSILNFFKQEYKDIIYPIETLIFLFISYYSDYNETVSPFLSIGPARLWNSFSLLHYSNDKKGYITFNQNNRDKDFKRDNTKSPYGFKGVLNKFLLLDSFNNNNKLLLEYDEHTLFSQQSYFSNYFVANLNEESLVLFFCFVYQQNLIKKFKECNIIKSNNYISDYNDLLKYAKEYQIKNSSITTNGNKKDIPELCGLLSMNELITRIKSLKWIFNYFQNGWKSDEFCNDYYNCANIQKTISIHGWTLIKFDPLKSSNNFSISSNHVLKFKKEQSKYDKGLPNTIYNIYDFYTVSKLSTIESKPIDPVLKILNI